MILPFGLMLKALDTFLLILMRMIGLFIVSPIFGRRNIPAYFKMGFSLLMAVILANTIQYYGEYENILQYTLVLVKEFLAGLAIGFISYMMFTAIYVAGQIIDMQIGFGMVNVIDPMSNIEVPVTANFYFIMCMLIFLAVNGHHAVIKAIFDSYEIIPVGNAVFGEAFANNVIMIFSRLFVVGFKIAAPVAASLLVADVALGIVSKAIPQLNVFIVGMPLKIILGIGVMIVTIPGFILLLEGLFNGTNSEMYNLMKSMVVND